MEVLFERIKSAIYHPVRGRVFYDIVAAILTSLFVSIIITLNLHSPLPILPLIIYPSLFITLNLFLGLYGRFRLGTISQKCIIVSFSSIFTGIVLYTYGANPLVVVFISLILLIVTTMPRIFVNVNKLPYELVKNYVDVSGEYILVTGGGGFIGTMLVEKLLEKNYKVRILDKFIYGKDVFKGMANIKNLELMEGDIADPFILTKSLLNVKAVIHLAGIVGEKAAELDEKLTRHVNIVSTRMLKETVKAFNIPRFIFASTTAVYESTLKVSDEKSRVHPISVYTKTKVDSEKELLFDTHDSFHPTILRISTAFGHSRKPKFDLVANLFVAQAYYTGKIHIINGTQWRSFIHVADIAEAFIKVLEAPIDKVSRQIFNVGDDSQRIQLSNLALVAKGITLNGKQIKIVNSETKNYANYKISFQKIKKTLNFSSSHSIESGILEVYTNIKKGAYKKNYKDSYYSSYEGARKVMKEFYTKKYRKTHYSTLS